MKRKVIIVVILILVIVLSGTYFTMRPKVLGNMSKSFSEPVTGMSSISFGGELNGKIKLSFASNIEAGELDIFLYDSNGNVVYELDRAKALETYYVLGKTDNYTLTAQYADFVGNYKISVYERK